MHSHLFLRIAESSCNRNYNGRMDCASSYIISFNILSPCGSANVLCHFRLSLLSEYQSIKGGVYLNKTKKRLISILVPYLSWNIIALIISQVVYSRYRCMIFYLDFGGKAKDYFPGMGHFGS
jgi:hypothetical protein